jgi:geranylgeranyl pyrophosphate synthase
MNLIDLKYLLMGKSLYDEFKTQFEIFFSKFCDDVAERITYMSLANNNEYVDKNISDFIVMIIPKYTSFESISRELMKIDIVTDAQINTRKFLISLNDEQLKFAGLSREDISTLEEISKREDSREKLSEFSLSYKRRMAEKRMTVSKEHYDKNIEKYMEQTKYVLMGGRRFRPTLVLLGYLLGSRDICTEMLSVASVIEFMHKYSLVIDDLYDNDDYRRGNIAFHKKYGEDEATEMISYLREIFIYNFTSPIASVMDRPLCNYNVADILYPAEICSNVFDVWGNAHQGFYDEINGRKENRVLSTSEVVEIERKQTSFIIKKALVCGYILGTNNKPDELIKSTLDMIGDISGIIFQIINDLEVFLSDEYQIGNKGKLYSDLESGAKNYVVSLIPEELAIDMSVEEKANYIKKNGLVNKTIDFLYNKFDECIELIKKLPYSETRSMLLLYLGHERKEISKKLTQKGYKRSDKVLGKKSKK